MKDAGRCSHLHWVDRPSKLRDINMWFPRFALLGFATQLPFMSSPSFPKMSTTIRDFELKTGKDRFSPKDLIELPRPGVGQANAAGDLVLASVSKYSFEEKKYGFPQFLTFARH